MSNEKIESNQTDLFYIDESQLATTDEEDFLNLYECGILPEKLPDNDFRAAYIAFLKENGYDPAE